MKHFFEETIVENQHCELLQQKAMDQSENCATG